MSGGVTFAGAFFWRSNATTNTGLPPLSSFCRVGYFSGDAPTIAQQFDGFDAGWPAADSPTRHTGQKTWEYSLSANHHRQLAARHANPSFHTSESALIHPNSCRIPSRSPAPKTFSRTGPWANHVYYCRSLIPVRLLQQRQLLISLQFGLFPSRTQAQMHRKAAWEAHVIWSDGMRPSAVRHGQTCQFRYAPNVSSEGEGRLLLTFCCRQHRFCFSLQPYAEEKRLGHPPA